MMRFIFGVAAVLLVAASAMRGATDNTVPRKTEVTVNDDQVVGGSPAIDLSAFAAEVETVERELAAVSGFSREELLVMYGRSAAASGRFDVAAAAYAMFLHEFGAGHPEADRIAMRLADCLFPFRYDQVDVIHSVLGPRLEPAWRMGYSPRPEHLRLAVPALELAASLAHDQHAKGAALLKLGWVHRLLGEWDASTAAWDRCARDCPTTKAAADALWLAAENLDWTNRPAEAAARLDQFARQFSSDARTPAAMQRMEHLRAESHRAADVLTDPVMALQAEIEARSDSHSPFRVYRSFVRGLQRRSQRAAQLTVSRWACGQTNWPVSERVIGCFDLVDALVAGGEQNAQEEAVERLREIVQSAPDMSAAVHAAIRCSRILRERDRHDEANQVMEEIAVKVEGSRQWEPIVLSEYADSLLKRGNGKQAMAVLKQLAASHPDYDVSEKLAAAAKAVGKEGE